MARTSAGAEALSERTRRFYAAAHEPSCPAIAHVALLTAGRGLYQFACTSCGWRSPCFKPSSGMLVAVAPRLVTDDDD